MAGGGRMAKWIECIQHIPSFHETTHYPMVLSQFFFFCLPAKLVTARDEAILLSPLWLALYLPFFVKSSQQPLESSHFDPTSAQNYVGVNSWPVRAEKREANQNHDR